MSDQTYRKAEEMFTAYNKARGAMMPGGFGFLSQKAQKPWLEAARKILTDKI